jgi:hypothetical protein
MIYLLLGYIKTHVMFYSFIHTRQGRTLDGGPLHYQSSSAQDLNWIFIPGGPGLGSEALSGLTTLLSAKIPGTIWHFDFPNDGSNK